MDTKEIIRKWYGLLEFPERFDSDLQKALEEYTVSGDTRIETYDVSCPDGTRNLLSFLYMCEETEKLYLRKKIDPQILTDTLKDIRIWVEMCEKYGKRFSLEETGWLAHHLSGELFKLGRLQFAFGKALCDAPSRSFRKGDPIIEVHIDNSSPLQPSECEESFRAAAAFFRTYFPEYRYRAFTCHSWLLGSSMTELLPEKSNILRFRERFDIIEEEPADDIIRYVFRWNSTRDSLLSEEPENSFAKAVKEKALKGGVFFIGYGILKEKNFL